jgi:tRNA modification GTPase
VSALTGEGTEALRVELRRRLVGTGQLEAPIITDARHARALEQTLVALGRAAEAGAAGLSEELVLEDLRDAMRCLGEITGEFTTDDLYDRIFSTFCIGK